MAIFGFGKGDEQTAAPVFTDPVDPGWVRNPKGGFFSFLDLDPEELQLNGVGGVYLIWHRGVRPEWVFVGHTKDMASAFHSAGHNSEITFYEPNGGLYVAWAPVMEEYRAGVVKYIEANFKTLVPNSNSYTDGTSPVPVIAPSRASPGKGK